MVKWNNGENMKVIVTGGAGFIGSHLVDRLIRDGFEVLVVDNLYRGKMENIAEHLERKTCRFYENDIRNYATLKPLFEDCDYVFHLAAQSNVMGAVENIDYSFETNVVGTFNVLKAAREAGVKRLIFTSSREAYGEARYLPVDEKHPLASKNTYGASKVAGEKYCAVFQNMGELEVVILRLGNVYGTRDFGRVIPIFLEDVLNNEDIHIYGGKQVIDFVAVEMIVETLIQSMANTKAPDSPTNVASGKGTTLFELATRIKNLTGTNSRVVVDPPRSVEVVRFTADISRFREVFDIEPPADPLYHLEDMIKQT